VAGRLGMLDALPHVLRRRVPAPILPPAARRQGLQFARRKLLQRLLCSADEGSCAHSHDTNEPRGNPCNPPPPHDTWGLVGLGCGV